MHIWVAKRRRRSWYCPCTSPQIFRGACMDGNPYFSVKISPLCGFDNPPPAPRGDSDPERWFGPWSQGADWDSEARDAAKNWETAGRPHGSTKALDLALRNLHQLSWFSWQKKKAVKMLAKWALMSGVPMLVINDVLLDSLAVLLWLPSTSQWSHHWPSLP